VLGANTIYILFECLWEENAKVQFNFVVNGTQRFTLRALLKKVALCKGHFLSFSQKMS
jgi:hypothetical protein